MFVLLSPYHHHSFLTDKIQIGNCKNKSYQTLDIAHRFYKGLAHNVKALRKQQNVIAKFRFLEDFYNKMHTASQVNSCWLVQSVNVLKLFRIYYFTKNLVHMSSLCILVDNGS